MLLYAGFNHLGLFPGMKTIQSLPIGLFVFGPQQTRNQNQKRHEHSFTIFKPLFLDARERRVTELTCGAWGFQLFFSRASILLLPELPLPARMPVITAAGAVEEPLPSELGEH